MESCLRLKRSPPLAELEPRTARSAGLVLNLLSYRGFSNMEQFGITMQKAGPCSAIGRAPDS